MVEGSRPRMQRQGTIQRGTTNRAEARLKPPGSVHLTSCEVRIALERVSQVTLIGIVVFRDAIAA